MHSTSPVVSFLAIGAIFCTALAGVFLPFRLKLAQSVERWVFRSGNAFSAGVLASAGFVHMLPDATDALHAVYPSKYPVAGVLALCGALLLFVFDNVVQSRATRLEMPVYMHTAVYGHDKAGRRAGGADATPSSYSPMVASASGPLIMYMLFMALSFHSVMEGLALGVNVQRSGDFFAIFGAIIAHKFFAAFALGIRMVRATDHYIAKGTVRVRLALLFASMTPLGALVGRQVSTNAPGNASWSAYLCGALTAMSAGIFIYVALVEILKDEFFPPHKGQPRKRSKVSASQPSHEPSQESNGALAQPRTGGASYGSTTDRSGAREIDEEGSRAGWGGGDGAEVGNVYGLEGNKPDDDENSSELLWLRVSLVLLGAALMSVLAVWV